VSDIVEAKTKASALKAMTRAFHIKAVGHDAEAFKHTEIKIHSKVSK